MNLNGSSDHTTRKLGSLKIEWMHEHYLCFLSVLL
jgi:hypothetical protein